MKKIIKVASFSLLVFLITFLIGCIHNTGDIGENDPIGNDSDNQTEGWFFTQNFNYNPEYLLYNQEERGFLIYDDADFGLINFASDIDVFSVHFDIYLDNKIISTTHREKYRLSDAGKYTIKVLGGNNRGEELEGEFSFNVIVGSRPNRVDFIIKNSQGEEVEQVRGGDDYTFTAKVYSDTKEYVPQNPKDIYWTSPTKAKNHEYTLSLGNIAREETRKYDFYCFIRNNNNTLINIVDESFTIFDNLIKTTDFPDGIYFDYGEDIVNKSLELNVNAAMDDGRYFYNGIRAEYRFDNGDVEELELSDQVTKGKAGIYISYDDDIFQVYSLKNYDYSVDSLGRRLGNYFSNGVKYQFEPTKTNAKIYMAVWSEKKNNAGYTNISPTKIEGSEISLELISQLPSSIEITSLSGSHKNDTEAFSNTYKTFEKTPVNGEIDLYICCDMDGDGDITDEYIGKSLSSIKQYFVVNVSTPDGNLTDYTITYDYDTMNSPIELRTFVRGPDGSILDRFFVCPYEGSATITIKSRFSPLECSITINVINKVFDSARRIYKYDQVYYALPVLDFADFIKIQEYKLSDYDRESYFLRDLREDEVLQYYWQDSLVSSDSLSYQNNGPRGHNITIKIKDTNITSFFSNVYILPNFKFSVNGNQYSLNDLSESKYYGLNITSQTDQKTTWFYGHVPVLNINSLKDFKIIDPSEMEEDENQNPRYSHKTRENSLIVEYLFYHITSGQKQVYKVEILNIDYK